MSFKSPNFWRRKNLWSFLLWPFSLVYWLGFCLRRCFARPGEVAARVICVGNVVLGGAGKTPMALGIGRFLRKKGVKFAYLSRAYGADFKGVREVKIGDDFRKVGDEPLLLCDQGPVFVAKNRYEGAKFVADKGFEVIILDDGMQNTSLKKDFTVMVIDAKLQFGNNMLFPAGPLRQSVKSGLKEADLVAVIGEGEVGLPEFERFLVKPLNIEEFRGQKLLAFCGLAYPEKFFGFLQENGLEVAQKVGFADHYAYKRRDLKELWRKAEENGLKLITTKKDWVKFDRDFREKIGFLDIEIEFSGEIC